MMAAESDSDDDGGDGVLRDLGGPGSFGGSFGHSGGAMVIEEASLPGEAPRPQSSGPIPTHLLPKLRIIREKPGMPTIQSANPLEKVEKGAVKHCACIFPAIWRRA